MTKTRDTKTNETALEQALRIVGRWESESDNALPVDADTIRARLREWIEGSGQAGDGATLEVATELLDALTD